MDDREVVARAELRALVDAYASTVDERDVAGFQMLFLEDAILAVVEPEATGEPFVCNGRAELPRALAPLDQYVATLHLMANHRCRLNGDSATGETYCLAHHLRPSDGGVEDLLMVIRYQDEYARLSEGWRFARRDVRIQWTEVHPASRAPLGDF